MVDGTGEPPLTSIADLAEEEGRLFISAQARLGHAFIMASNATCLLSTFIASVSADRNIFIRCMAILKAHHTLALLSIARRHHVQAMLNLRQVVEAASNAAFALAHPNANYIDPHTKLIMNPEKTNRRSYKWISENYSSYSSELSQIKDHLNENSTHFNLTNSSRIVADAPYDGVWETGYFDRADLHLEKTDLWFLTLSALCTMHLVNAVRDAHGGVVFAADFEDRANAIALDWENIKAALTTTPRHLAATKSAERAEAMKQVAKAPKDR